MRYVRDVLWRELDRDTDRGYRADGVKALFGGFSAGGFGTLYNYHWVLDDLEWAHTAAYPDAGLALDNGQTVGVRNLGILLISDDPPLGWGSQNYLPSYCTTTDCGVGPVVLEHMAPRLLSVPEQQILVLSNQVDDTQVVTTFFDTTPDWINTMRASYCQTRDLPGVNYFLPAIPQSTPRDQSAQRDLHRLRHRRRRPARLHGQRLRRPRVHHRPTPRKVRWSRPSRACSRSIARHTVSSLDCGPSRELGPTIWESRPPALRTMSR
jgi:hypothetical protein